MLVRLNNRGISKMCSGNASGVDTLRATSHEGKGPLLLRSQTTDGKSSTVLI